MDSLAQLPLNIHLDSSATFTNFFVGDNIFLVDYLQNFLENKDDWFAYIWGAAGNGRTHLLQATYHQLECHHQAVVYIPLAEVKTTSPKILEDLERFALVVLDDVQVVVGEPHWEEAIFHLYNRIQLAKHNLLISSTCAPSQLNFKLGDLNSRVMAGTIFKVQPLSEEQKVAALQLQAIQYGLTLSGEVAAFMLHHCPRDIPSLFAMLKKLDHASLVSKRKLTIPFVKEVLQLN